MDLEKFSARLSARIEHALQSQLSKHMTAIHVMVAKVAWTEISFTPPQSNLLG